MPETTGNGEFKGATAARLTRVEEDLHEHIMGCPVKEAVKDHESRIRTLEATRWQIIGILAAVQTVGVGVVLAALKAWLP
jgi:hypothetical protein